LGSFLELILQKRVGKYGKDRRGSFKHAPVLGANVMMIPGTQALLAIGYLIATLVS